MKSFLTPTTKIEKDQNIKKARTKNVRAFLWEIYQEMEKIPIKERLFFRRTEY